LPRAGPLSGARPVSRARPSAIGPQNLIAAATAEIHPILNAATVAAKPIAHARIIVPDALPVFRPVLPVVAGQGVYPRPVDVDVVVVPIPTTAPVIPTR
jgi:hypothetical protein